MDELATLTTWRRLLKEGGYCAVTEITWLVPDPSDEPSRFREENYPAMTTTDGNIDTAE